jgi:hypothetical protein
LRCQPVICVRKKRKCQHKSLLFDRFIFHVYSGRYQDLQTIEIIHKWEWNETTGGEMTFECFWKSMGTWASTNKFSLSTTKQTSAFPSLSYFIRATEHHKTRRRTGFVNLWNVSAIFHFVISFLVDSPQFCL